MTISYPVNVFDIDKYITFSQSPEGQALRFVRDCNLLKENQDSGGARVSGKRYAGVESTRPVGKTMVSLSECAKRQGMQTGSMCLLTIVCHKQAKHGCCE